MKFLDPHKLDYVNIVTLVVVLFLAGHLIFRAAALTNNCGVEVGEVYGMEQAVDGSGYVEFGLTLADDDGDTAEVKIEYSDDGGKNFYYAYLAAATADNQGIDLNNDYVFQLRNVVTRFGQSNIWVTWDTKSDKNGHGSLDKLKKDSVIIRVTPCDCLAHSENKTACPSYYKLNELDNLGQIINTQSAVQASELENMPQEIEENVASDADQATENIISTDEESADEEETIPAPDLESSEDGATEPAQDQLTETEINSVQNIDLPVQTNDLSAGEQDMVDNVIMAEPVKTEIEETIADNIDFNIALDVIEENSPEPESSDLVPETTVVGEQTEPLGLSLETEPAEEATERETEAQQAESLSLDEILTDGLDAELVDEIIVLAQDSLTELTELIISPIQPVVDSQAQQSPVVLLSGQPVTYQSKPFTVDNQSPELVSLDLEIGQNMLKITFTENLNTLLVPDLSKIFLRPSLRSATAYPLSGENEYSWQADNQLLIWLSEEDVAYIASDIEPDDVYTDIYLTFGKNINIADNLGNPFNLADGNNILAVMPYQEEEDVEEEVADEEDVEDLEEDDEIEEEDVIDDVELDKDAVNSCFITPFSQTINHGDRAQYVLDLNPSYSDSAYKIIAGRTIDHLNLGFSKTTGQGADEISMTVTTDSETETGSFNIIIIYQEMDKNSMPVNSYCQFNLVID